MGISMHSRSEALFYFRFGPDDFAVPSTPLLIEVRDAVSK
jgi:hypothetical protein